MTKIAKTNVLMSSAHAALSLTAAVRMAERARNIALARMYQFEEDWDMANGLAEAAEAVRSFANDPAINVALLLAHMESDSMCAIGAIDCPIRRAVENCCR